MIRMRFRLDGWYESDSQSSAKTPVRCITKQKALLWTRRMLHYESVFMQIVVSSDRLVISYVFFAFQYRVESLLGRTARAANFLLPSPSVAQRARQRAPEAIPLNLEPDSSLFVDGPVAVLDFQSLYPSVIIAYNYCYSTVLGRLTSLGRGWVDKTVVLLPDAMQLRLSCYFDSQRRFIIDTLLHYIWDILVTINKSNSVCYNTLKMFRSICAQSGHVFSMDLGFRLLDLCTFVHFFWPSVYKYWAFDVRSSCFAIVLLLALGRNSS